MRSLIGIVCLCLMLSAVKSPVHAQVNAALSGQLQSTLDSVRLKYNMTGLSAAIAMPGNIVWCGTSGMSDPSAGKRINAAMHFGIGSVTKTFVTAIIMQLSEENKLSIDDPLYKWLPAFSNIDSLITIRQLLSHTSGIYNYTNHYQLWYQMLYGGNRVWQPEEILSYILSPSFARGTRYEYSNTNFILLGMIIKKVTGTGLSFQLHSRLLDTRGLKNIFLEAEDTIKGEVADCWSDYDYDGVMENAMLLPRVSLYSGAWAAGGMFSDAADLTRWARYLYNGDVVTKSSLEQMLAFTRLSNYYYGLGTARYLFAGREMWGHGGGVPGFRTLFCYSKKDDIGLVVMLNDDTGNPDRAGSALMDTYVRSAPAAVETPASDSPQEYRLWQNYPNPFNPVTRINYSIPVSSVVKLSVYDLLGNEVKVIVNEMKLAGTHAALFDGSMLPSGLYLYRLSAGKFHDIKKLLLVK